MKKILLLIAMAGICGCASLTSSQIEAVNQFATTSEHFSAYPSKIMTGLADLRVKRGIYFSNSLDNTNAHIEDLNNLYAAKKDDYKSSAKADISFKIIDKYAQSLKLLSSDKHGADLATQAKHFGTSLDSLITTYNTIPGITPVRTGIGGIVGAVIMAGGKQLVKTQQAKAIREFVPQGDTMIAVMTNNLLEFLQSGTIDLLIKNEERGVESNYRSFLNQRKPTVENERDYLELKEGLDNIKKLRGETVDATRSLRKAHAKILSEIREKKDLKEVIAELQSFYEDVNEVKSTIDALNTSNN